MDGGWDDAGVTSPKNWCFAPAPISRERMNRFAETMPVAHLELRRCGGDTAERRDCTLRCASGTRSSRVRGTPKKLKKLFAQIPEVVFERNGITLDDEDKTR